MRYLLDELMSYEEGFGNILMEDRASERHDTFMGTSEAAAGLTKRDLDLFEDKFLQQVHTLIHGLPGV